MDMEDLPKSLQKAIEDMEGAWAKVDEGKDSKLLPQVASLKRYYPCPRAQNASGASGTGIENQQ